MSGMKGKGEDIGGVRTQKNALAASNARAKHAVLGNVSCHPSALSSRFSASTSPFARRGSGANSRSISGHAGLPSPPSLPHLRRRRFEACEPRVWRGAGAGRKAGVLRRRTHRILRNTLAKSYALGRAPSYFDATKRDVRISSCKAGGRHTAVAARRRERVRKGERRAKGEGRTHRRAAAARRAAQAGFQPGA